MSSMVGLKSAKVGLRFRGGVVDEVVSEVVEDVAKETTCVERTGVGEREYDE